jgi:hypothetical protein
MKRCHGSAGFLLSSSPRLQHEDRARQEANLQMMKRRSGAAVRMSGETLACVREHGSSRGAGKKAVRIELELLRSCVGGQVTPVGAAGYGV